MRKPVRGVLLWLTNNLSYEQKYVVAGFVRGIGYLILFFSLLWMVQSNLALVNSQISTTAIRGPLEKALQLISKSDLRIYEGAGEANLDGAFSSALKDLKAKYAQENLLSERVLESLAEIESLWGISVESANAGRKAEAFEANARIRNALTLLLEKDADEIITGRQPLSAGYLILERVQRRLRDDQSLIRTAEAVLSGEAPESGPLQLATIASSLRRSIGITQEELFKARQFLQENAEFDDAQKKIRLTLNQYSVSLQELALGLDQSIEGEEQRIILLSEAANAMSYNYNLWTQIGTELNAILEHRKNSLWFSLVLIFTLAAFFTILGSWLGVHFVYEAIKSFRDLDRATRALTTGDLSARVQVIYREEIGLASQAFNVMADYLERLISQQRKLFDATRLVAEGDFSARVEIDLHADEEINQVTISFNKMVGTFQEIVRQLHRLGINLTSSAGEITAASKRQEKLILEQGEATREISITASEISTTAKDFASTINEVSGVAEQTSNLASEGQDSLIKMEQIMRQMVQASINISEKLAVLNEKAGNITKVVTTIKNVARQTNLLSLNAAIEAEMTGQYSRDFGVIAREIRRLADQTALATYDIEQIVDEIMEAVGICVSSVEDFTGEIHAGVEKVAEVGEQLGTIIVQVQALAFRFESVNEGMQSQSLSAGKINDGMVQLSTSASSTTESIQQFQNTIEKLSHSANELSSMIEDLTPQK